MGLLGALFGRRLWLTNTVSSGALMAAGDAIQQLLEFQRGVHREHRYSWARTGRMFAVGLTQGPPHHIWYSWLDRRLPGRSARVVRLKILADQLVAAPFFAVTFFLGAGLLEGKPVTQCLDEFKRKFPEVYLFDWFIWPPTQWVNFRYVPERYRVLYVNAVTVLWDVFLSYIKHRDQVKDKADCSVSVRDHSVSGSASDSSHLSTGACVGSDPGGRSPAVPGVNGSGPHAAECQRSAGAGQDRTGTGTGTGTPADGERTDQRALRSRS